MPYIKRENRSEMDKVIEALHEDILYNDELIYILFEYCNQHIKPSYNNYKNFCGELCQCATEVERRTGSEEISIVNIKTILPFVSKGRLELCNGKIEFMKGADIKVNGDLNYILYGFAIRNLILEQFSHFSEQLRLAAKKITVEILAPYEDQKIEENGDVY